MCHDNKFYYNALFLILHYMISSCCDNPQEKKGKFQNLFSTHKAVEEHNTTNRLTHIFAKQKKLKNLQPVYTYYKIVLNEFASGAIQFNCCAAFIPRRLGPIQLAKNLNPQS